MIKADNTDKRCLIACSEAGVLAGLCNCARRTIPGKPLKEESMTDLEKYEAVNKTKSLDELADCILGFAVDGVIEGRPRPFDAKLMANACRNYSLWFHSALTREFGIRQQAMYILFYTKDGSKSVEG